MTDGPQDDRVGYGRPPKHSQFKKGQSGNPKGRPKRKYRTVDDLLDKVLDEKVQIEIGGKPRKVPRKEVLVRQHVMQALKSHRAMAGFIKDLRHREPSQINFTVEMFERLLEEMEKKSEAQEISVDELKTESPAGKKAHGR